MTVGSGLAKGATAARPSCGVWRRRSAGCKSSPPPDACRITSPSAVEKHGQRRGMPTAVLGRTGSSLQRGLLERDRPHPGRPDPPPNVPRCPPRNGRGSRQRQWGTCPGGTCPRCGIGQMRRRIDCLTRPARNGCTSIYRAHRGKAPPRRAPRSPLTMGRSGSRCRQGTEVTPHVPRGREKYTRGPGVRKGWGKVREKGKGRGKGRGRDTGRMLDGGVSGGPTNRMRRSTGTRSGLCD